MALPGTLTVFDDLACGKDLQQVTHENPESSTKAVHTIDTTWYCDTKWRQSIATPSLDILWALIMQYNRCLWVMFLD